LEQQTAAEPARAKAKETADTLRQPAKKAKKKIKKDFRARHESFAQVEGIAKRLLRTTEFSDFDAFLEKFREKVDEQVTDKPNEKTWEERWGERFWSMRRQTKWLNTG
jgi:arginine utilization protein RocB